MATIRDIAARSGFSKSTVSLALQKHPRIPAATREMVLKVAGELGYRANPVFAHMMRSVRSAGSLVERATFGILHGFPDPQLARSNPYHAEWVAGARERAGELAYIVDEIWMQQPGMSARRLSDIIRARGINALLIAPLPERRGVQLDWDCFTAVTAGYSLVEPRLSRVVPNHQQVMIICLRHLAARGYRRIGLLLNEGMDPLVRFNLAAPFLWYQSQTPKSAQVPIFNLEAGARAQFLRWFKRHRPEALVSVNGSIVDWLGAAGFVAPADVGLVFSSRTVAPPGFSCVDQQPRKLGAAAVDLLIGQMNRAEFGLPQNPKTVFTDAVWSEGTSLRQLRAPLTTPRLDFL